MIRKTPNRSKLDADQINEAFQAAGIDHVFWCSQGPRAVQFFKSYEPIIRGQRSGYQISRNNAHIAALTHLGPNAAADLFDEI